MKIRRIFGYCSVLFWLSFIIWGIFSDLYYKVGLTKELFDGGGGENSNTNSVGVMHHNSMDMPPGRKSITVEESETYEEAVERVTGLTCSGQLSILAFMAGGFQYFAMRKGEKGSPIIGSL